MKRNQKRYCGNCRFSENSMTVGRSLRCNAEQGELAGRFNDPDTECVLLKRGIQPKGRAWKPEEGRVEGTAGSTKEGQR